jgi:hypothetical protein
MVELHIIDWTMIYWTKTPMLDLFYVDDHLKGHPWMIDWPKILCLEILSLASVLRDKMFGIGVE